MTKALSVENSEVAKVAKKAAEGLKNTAPDVAEMLKKTAKPIEAVAKRMAAAKKTPGKDSKPSTETEAANDATTAAKQLTEAAAHKREDTKAAADKLAKVAGEQLKEIVPAREAVEEAAHKPAGVADRLERLKQAEDKIREAQGEQQRAAGKPEAADAANTARRSRRFWKHSKALTARRATWPRAARRAVSALLCSRIFSISWAVLAASAARSENTAPIVGRTPRIRQCRADLRRDVAIRPQVEHRDRPEPAEGVGEFRRRRNLPVVPAQPRRTGSTASRARPPTTTGPTPEVRLERVGNNKPMTSLCARSCSPAARWSRRRRN